jgi:Restriction endonuclease fold toxin 7
LDIDVFKYRASDPQIGRLWSIDPLAESYVYNSPYALQENKFGRGVELEGLELGGLFFSSSNAIPRTTFLEAASKPTIKPRFSPEQKANFNRGQQVEAEQLQKINVPKNTKPIEAIDPKTGNKGTTIPDGMKGDQTVEVKNVSNQSLSRQLRLQKEISNAAGETPILRINQNAKLSNPLKEAGFEIQTYSAPPIKADNTKVNTNYKIQNVPSPCALDPNCA